MLETVKKAMLIPEDEHYADVELVAYIDACKELIISAGVSETIVDAPHPAVVTLVVIYCKTFYGFKSDGSVKELPKSFDMLLRQLLPTKGGIPDVS